jgi:hypothetical protein
MLKRTLVVALATLTTLNGCGERVVPDPTPSAEIKAELSKTRLAVATLGEPFEVDGCTVQAHRVHVSGNVPNFTLATAKCPTATVRATENSCGKNCTNSVVQVIPGLSPEATLVSKESAERAQLKADLKQTREEVARLKEKLSRLSPSVP